MDKWKNYQVILGSKSPRRQELLKTIIPHFRTEIRDIEETYPPDLKQAEIVTYLAKLKASAINVAKNQLLITADTLVCIENKVLGKPIDEDDAATMLSTLSGKTHKVITGVCITTREGQNTISETTLVTFKPLSETEIRQYILQFQPFDKAGAYGIQENGSPNNVFVDKIQGSYSNAVGLPVERLGSLFN